MKIEIEQSISGMGPYTWKLETGPERIDSYTGECESLGKCFEEIIRYETINGMDYR